MSECIRNCLLGTCQEYLQLLCMPNSSNFQCGGCSYMLLSVDTKSSSAVAPTKQHVYVIHKGELWKINRVTGIK